MLSSILQLNVNSSIPFEQLPIVRRFMKGLFELCPALPRYKSIWDLNIVFNYFRGRPAAPELSLKELTLKLTFLLNLLSGKRCQTIKYLNTDNMELTTDKCICKSILNEGLPLERTVSNYFLSHVKPHGPVRKDTISRWCKSVLSSVGIDTSKFKGHSTRAASSTHLADNDKH